MAGFRLSNVLAKLTLAAAALAVGSAALAQNVTDFFELEGNVAQGATGKDDWASVNAGAVGPRARTGVLVDPAPNSIFTTGGSKDDINIPSWKFKNGSVPDKDDIVNAYAAAYIRNNQLYIYAGAERFDNSGDAFIGFWFFQSSVGTPVGATSGSFTGTHTVGDLLVLANFTGGGTNVSIELLKWVGSGGSVNGTLERVLVDGQAVVNARCGAAGTPATVCAITNAGLPAETPPTWSYQSKSGSSAFIPAGFFELGINVSALLGSTPCFASFLAETRASSSVSATLKDFVAGNLPVCGIEVTKNCNSGQFNVATQNFTFNIAGQVLNNGFGTLNSVKLTDDPPIPANAFSYFVCDANKLPDETQPVNFTGSLAGGASVCYKASFVSATNAPSDSIKAEASAGTTPITPATAGATCPNINVPSVVQVTKRCDTILEADATRLFVAVNVAGQVCNIGSSTLTNVSVTDPYLNSGANLVPNTTLTAGACKDYSGKYFPNLNNLALNRLAPSSTTFLAGLAMFKDTVTANATSAFGTVTPAEAVATCNLCPTCTNPDACSLNAQGAYVCKATNLP